MIQIGIFTAITAGAMALFIALSDAWKPGRARLRRRLAGEYEERTVEASTQLYKDVATLDEGSHDNDRTASTGRNRGSVWMENILREAGIERNPRTVLLAVGIAAVLLATLGLLLGGWLVGATLYLAAIVGPIIYLNAMRKARRERYSRQLAGAFELMARVLKSGQPVQEAFRAAIAGFREPLSSEFSLCLHQIEHGIRPETAFRELSDRSGVLELRLFVVAMTIQRQTGGSLTEVLERMAAVVRTRLRLRQKIRALTAEGRMQSLTLLLLPFLTFGVMYFLNRTYAEALLVQWRLLAATGALMVIGMLWIRNIMNFEG